MKIHLEMKYFLNLWIYLKANEIHLECHLSKFLLQLYILRGEIFAEIVFDEDLNVSNSFVI